MILVADNRQYQGKVGDDKPDLKQIKTLSTVVTTCLAPCAECCGEYIDSTSSFRIICHCSCNHNHNPQSAGQATNPRPAADDASFNPAKVDLHEKEGRTYQ